MAGLAGIHFRMSRRRNPQRLIANHDFPRLPIEFEKHRSLAVRMWLADRKTLHQEGFSGFYLDGDLLSRSHPVEKLRRGQDADITEGVAELDVFEKNLGIEQIAQYIVTLNRTPYFLLQSAERLLEIGGRQITSRPNLPG